MTTESSQPNHLKRNMMKTTVAVMAICLLNAGVTYIASTTMTRRFDRMKLDTTTQIDQVKREAKERHDRVIGTLFLITESQMKVNGEVAQLSSQISLLSKSEPEKSPAPDRSNYDDQFSALSSGLSELSLQIGDIESQIQELEPYIKSIIKSPASRFATPLDTIDDKLDRMSIKIDSIYRDSFTIR